MVQDVQSVSPALAANNTAAPRQGARTASSYPAFMQYFQKRLAAYAAQQSAAATANRASGLYQGSFYDTAESAGEETTAWPDFYAGGGYRTYSPVIEDDSSAWQTSGGFSPQPFYGYHTHCPYCQAAFGPSLANGYFEPPGQYMSSFWDNYYNLEGVSGWDGDMDYLNGLYGVTDTTATGSLDQPNGYSAVKVGEIARAPMAMFEHDGQLVMSVISRNGIGETPVYGYEPGGSINKVASLPEQVESGHYGYSTGDEFHLVTESNGGLIDYTSYGLDGDWQRHDYTSLVPHEYKNLTWGSNYLDETSGRQFMGFGRGDNPGMVMSYDSGQWDVLAAPEDMRFPTGYGVINSGSQAGALLVSSSSYGHSVLHAVQPDGSTETLKTFDAWGIVKVHEEEGVAYYTAEEKVYWSSLDDLKEWKEVKYKVDGEYRDRMETNGGPVLHPVTGRMLFPASSSESNNLRVYEAHKDGDDITLVSVANIEGLGAWAAKSAVVGDEVYVGAGVADGREADRVPGAIYRLELNSAVDQG